MEATYTYNPPELSLEMYSDVRQFINMGAMSLIDIGCYHGMHSALMARLGLEVTGLDCRYRNVPEGVRFIQGDARCIDYYGRFDIALCNNLIYHLENPVDFLARLRTAVKILILGTCVMEPFAGSGFNLSYLAGCEGVWLPQEEGDAHGSDMSPTFCFTEDGLNRATEISGFTFIKEYSRLQQRGRSWPLQLYI